MKRAIIILSLILLPGMLQAQPVKICDDGAEWAPFIYYERVNGKKNKSKLVGFVPELMQEVFEIVGLKHSMKLIPWKRCQARVEDFGESRKYEALTDASFSMERANKYWATAPLYEMRDGVFYSIKKYPNAPQITKPYDLVNFRLCGVLGYNYELMYEEYGVPRSKKVNTGAVNTMNVLEKISLGRGCDLIQSSIAIVYGGEAIGQYKIPSDIRSMPIPGGKRPNYHMFIAKTSPRAYELLTKINQALLILKNNGVSKKIYKKYIPNYIEVYYTKIIAGAV